MSASATRAIALQGPAKPEKRGCCTRKISGKEFLFSLRGFLTVHTRCGGGVQSFPRDSEHRPGMPKFNPKKLGREKNEQQAS